MFKVKTKSAEEGITATTQKDVQKGNVRRPKHHSKGDHDVPNFNCCPQRRSWSGRTPSVYVQKKHSPKLARRNSERQIAGHY